MTTEHRCAYLLSCCLLLIPSAAPAQKPGLVVDREPVLRVEANGPTAFVTSLAFGADEKSLFAAGYDKLVHSWALDRDGTFAPGKGAYRVPLGPGVTGSINSIAMSSDGNWLAVASRGVMRGSAGFRQLGISVPASAVTPEMWEDQGVILVFNTRTGDARELRGHRGRVASLAFAPARAGSPPLLASIAREYRGKDFAGDVRLWDVDTGKEIARLPDLPDLFLGNQGLWPHLDLWRTGAKGDNVRVALAWEDGFFRLWDVKDGKGEVVKVREGEANNTVARLPGKEQVLTCSTKESKGILTVWDLSGREPAVDRQVELAKGQKPRALALFAAEAGGPINRAAVAVEVPGKQEHVFDYFLLVVDLTDLKQVRPPVPLWTGPSTSPTLAASPGGRFLAAAGNKDHEVLLFARTDLLKNKDDRQKLRGVGATIRFAAFVKSGKEAGLVLSETALDGIGKPPRPPRRDDLVFDFTRRSLSDEAAAWQLDTPDLEGWEVKASSPRDDNNRIKEHVLEVRHKGEEPGAVHLPPNEFITAYALLPGKGKRPPLLAVGILELGQPILRIYNVRTGEAVSQLTGHVNRVHSLAFSGSRPLLVSTSEDQTVCVWKLIHLDETLGRPGDVVLGRQGTLHGLVVGAREAGPGLVVAEINEQATPLGNLKALNDAGVVVGDVVEGFVVKGKLQSVATPGDFYNELVLTPPGRTVTVRFSKRGDIKLVVGQVTAAIKPLLSLFVTRPGKGGVRHWVGWNPVGPYDFSDRDAERLLGWQQNTGDPKQPALYAEAREYRPANYKPDILRYLVEHGDTSPAVEAWKKDHPEKIREPKIALWIKELGPEARPDADGRLLLEQTQVTLQLSVNELPAEQIRSVRWQRGEESGDLERTPDGDWTADLSGLAWQRGNYLLRVTLKTTEGQSYPRELALRYQPPRPEVKVVGSPPRVVDREDYVLEAKITPATGHEVVLNVTQQHDGKEVRTESRQITKAETVKEKFTLREGMNQLKLLARNKDGKDADADWISVDVLYKPKTPPPQISLTAVVPSPDGAVLRVDPEPVVVDTPHAFIVGTIEALKPLTAVSWVSDARGDKEQPISLDRESPRSLSLSQKVALAGPGQVRKFTFFATADGIRIERSLSLRYEPRLPELRLTSPVEGQPLFEGKDSLTVRVEGRLVWPDAQPCTAQVIVNDKEQDEPVKLDGKATTFTASAKLQPGENWLQVRLKNEWHEVTTPRQLVSYRRPPRVVSFTAPEKSTKPYVDAVVLVASPKTLPLTSLRIQGHDLPAARFAPVVDQEKGDVTVWKLLLKEMPLQKGKNVLTFNASNSDGWALQPAEVTVLSEDPVQPKATVDLLSPAQDGVVETAEVPVDFLIRSESPLRKVEIQRNGTVVFQKEKADLAKLEKNSSGLIEFRETQKVPLQTGSNALKVVVQNDGGEQSSRGVVMTYQSGPATILVTHLVAGLDLQPISFVGGKLLFPEVPQAKVVVHGRVVWGQGSDTVMAKVTQVRVYVNGAQQPPVPLELSAGNTRERTFKAEIRLTRAKDNYVTVKLPDLAEDTGSRNHCILDCKQPDTAAEPRRQVHLLVIDTGTDGEREVVARVLQAIQAVPAGENRFTKTGFADGGRIYGPLIGAEVSPERVYKQLLSIKRNLRLRSASGANNDVVMIYFRGSEALDNQGHFLRTADSARDPELRWSGLPCENLTRYCEENLGSQLVLLDVTRENRAGTGPPPQDKVLQWPDDPSVAVFRYSWSGLPGEQDPSARLLTDWAQSHGHGKKLIEVVDYLAGKFLRTEQKPWPSQRYPKNLTYSQQLPPGLEDVQLGGP